MAEETNYLTEDLVHDPWAAENFANFDEDLMTDDERAKLLEDQYVVDEDFPPEPELTVRVKRGTFYSDAYIAPDVNRQPYIQDLHAEAVQTDYADYAELKGQTLVHADRTGSLDWYHDDFIRILRIMKGYYGDGRLYIINGFRHPDEVGINPHGIGIAADIQVNSWEHARRVMNAAHIAGMPTIIPAGDIESGQGHIHLDMAPTADYTYDAGEYAGPWS